MVKTDTNFRAFLRLVVAAFLIPQHVTAASDSGAVEDDVGFAKGLWGAFLFSIIGLAAFVAVLTFLIKFVCDRSPDSTPARDPKPKKQPKENFPPNSNIANHWNEPYEQQELRTPAAMSSMDGQMHDFGGSTPNSPYSPQNQSDQFFNQSLPYEQQTNPMSSTPYVTSTFATYPPETVYEPTSSIYPAVVPDVLKSPTTESYQEPFQYLEKYKPVVQNDQENLEKLHMDELATKRAVLREATPYQVIEDRVQGEEYDDKEVFTPLSPSLTPSPRTGHNLSSGSFTDGKTRMVRVLPRFHHESSPTNNYEQPFGTQSSMLPPSPPYQQNNYTPTQDYY